MKPAGMRVVNQLGAAEPVRVVSGNAEVRHSVRLDQVDWVQLSCSWWSGTSYMVFWYLMALNIKDASVHEAVKQIAKLTGESQAQAVATAVNERLARLQGDDLAARLLIIGHKAASRMNPETKQLDHGALLYDERGLPA